MYMVSFICNYNSATDTVNIEATFHKSGDAVPQEVEVGQRLSEVVQSVLAEAEKEGKKQA